MAKEKIAPHFVHRLETRRAVAEESGAVAVFGRQIMDERDAIRGEGVDMRQALRDREFAGRGRDDRKAHVDDMQRALDRKSTRLNSSHYCASRMTSSA